MSVGTATMPSMAVTPEDLLVAADASLYAAKQDGRDGAASPLVSTSAWRARGRVGRRGRSVGVAGMKSLGGAVLAADVRGLGGRRERGLLSVRTAPRCDRSGRAWNHETVSSGFSRKTVSQ